MFAPKLGEKVGGAHASTPLIICATQNISSEVPELGAMVQGRRVIQATECTEVPEVHTGATLGIGGTGAFNR